MAGQTRRPGQPPLTLPGWVKDVPALEPPVLIAFIPSVARTWDVSGWTWCHCVCRLWGLGVDSPSVSVSWGCHLGCKGPLEARGTPRLTRLQTARAASLPPSLSVDGPTWPQCSREQLEPFHGLVAVAVEGSLWRVSGEAVSAHADWRLWTAPGKMRDAGRRL